MTTETNMSVATTEEGHWPKFTAEMIEGDCPRLLRDLGKRITAHLERAHKAEGKAEQHRIAAAQHLAQARDLCDAGGFTAFHEKFYPDLGRSRTYELLAIATGKSSIEHTRASTRERVARHRAKKTESVTEGDVTDSTTPIAAPATDESVADDPQGSAKARMALYAAASGQDAGETEPASAPDAPTAPEIAPAPDAPTALPVPVSGVSTASDPDHVDADATSSVSTPEPAPETESASAPEPAPNAPKSKKKPSLIESWESSQEDRDAIRDLVLEDYFPLADGRNILSRIRGAKRDVVIRDFLDALGVDGVQATASPNSRRICAPSCRSSRTPG
jgi:hypothetical protein